MIGRFRVRGRDDDGMGGCFPSDTSILVATCYSINNVMAYVLGLATPAHHGFLARQKPPKSKTGYLMHYKPATAGFLLVSAALIWTGVFRLNGSTLLNAYLAPLYQLIVQGAPPLPKTTSRWSPWLGLNDDILSYICQFYGPVRFHASDRQNIGKVLKVLTALNRLFENLKYVGTIEVDEVLAYYLLLSELSFVKKRYPDELERKLMQWPLPKGNLTLSLLISTGNINKSTFDSLAFYLPYISDKSARLAAVNYFLDARAEGSIQYDRFGYILMRILISAFEPGLVSKWKRILRPSALSSDLFNVDIAGCLLHFAPVERGEALIDDLRDALAVVANRGMFAQFCAIFIRYPTTLRDQDSMQVIFKRNIQEFQAIPFTAEQWTVLSVINKIRFGAPQDIKDMCEAERKALFRMFSETGKFALVFHIWAREDVPANVWEQFDNDPSNDCILSRLAFGLEGLFQDYFDVDLVNDNHLDFCYFLNQFKDYPSSSKKQRFQELLRAKVQEHSEVVLALI